MVDAVLSNRAVAMAVRSNMEEVCHRRQPSARIADRASSVSAGARRRPGSDWWVKGRMMNPGTRKRLSEKSVSSASTSQRPLFLDRWLGTMIPLPRVYSSVYMHGATKRIVFLDYEQ